jgi:hypothetical protein
MASDVADDHADIFAIWRGAKRANLCGSGDASAAQQSLRITRDACVGGSHHNAQS